MVPSQSSERIFPCALSILDRPISQASEFHPIHNHLQNGASNISILKNHSVLSCVAQNLSQWNSSPQKSYPERQIALDVIGKKTSGTMNTFEIVSRISSL